MYRILIRIIAILIWLITSLNAGIVNKDTPARGTWNLNPSLCWSINQAGNIPILKVNSFSISPDEKIYLFDASHKSFFVFSKEGNFLFRFGKPGEGPGEYRNVFTSYITAERFIVLAMKRLHIYKLDGTPVKAVHIPFDFPRFFVDRNRYMRIKKSENKQEKTDTLSLFDINDHKDRVIATVKYEKALEARGNSGMTLRVSLPSFTGGVISAFHKGFVYYGFNSSYSIKKIDLNGKELMEFSLEGREKEEITNKNKRDALEGISFNGGKIPERMIKNMIKGIPDEAPYFNSIHIAENGNIYVSVNNLKSNSRTFDIFSSEGRYLYTTTFTLPEGLTIKRGFRIYKNHIYVYVEDEEGETELRKYRVELP